MTIEYALVQASDIPRAFEIESAGFPSDEAASLPSLETRQKNAAPYFLGAYSRDDDSSPRTLIGYICSTLTSSSTLTHDSMSTHDPTGSFVAIHSVCVDKSCQGQGIAKGLLKEYLHRLREMSREGQIKGARLIAHEELVPLYQKAGFELVGKSQVVHGPREWFELKVDFVPPPSGPSASTSFAVVAAAAAPQEEDEGPNVRSPGLPLSRFPSGVESLIHPETYLNTADLYCPRPECRCLLLRKGTGRWVRSHPSDFELPALPRPISSSTSVPPPSSPPHQSGYWSIPSPLSFENIGFSRNAAPPSSSSPSPSPQSHTSSVPATIKYLTCADCDHGPLGWHDTEGRDLGIEVQEENEERERGVKGKGEVRKGREFLLSVGRVRYKA
ncbi:hypothetical protein JCM11641_000385 [Rhodosporidiobolus odoratus]